MAKKSASGKKSSSKNDESIVRIKASSSAPKKEKKAPVVAEVVTDAQPAKKPKAKREKKAGKNVLTAIGGYFKGAWTELRLVRWPTRRATWSLTGAVLIYSAFFVVLVLLLDAAFKFLFELILGK